MPDHAPWNRLTSPTVVRFAAMLLGFSALTYVGVAIFWVAGAQFTIKPIWGVVLAILLMAGPRSHGPIYLATCIASLAVRLATGSPLVDSVIATAGGIGSVWAIQSLQRRIQGPNINFRDWLELIEFFAITLYGTLAVGMAYAGSLSIIYHRDFLQILEVSALPTLLSFVIFTPLLVLTTTIQLAALRRIKYRLAVSAVASLAVMAFICSGAFPYYYPVPLILLVVTLACDIEGTLVGLLITVAALTFATLSGYGPTRNILPFPKQLLFDQIFLLALIFTLLPVAVAISERRRLHRDLLAALRHKETLVAEQRLLYSASELLRDRSYDESVLKELVALIPQGWQFSECCQARISYRDVHVATADWHETPWLLSVSFATRRGSGIIEIGYLEKRPEAVEGPFLAEERSMLNALSEMLVSYLEHEEIELERSALEEQLRQAQRKEAMGTLAGGIAHDFNNILAAIQGFSGLLHDDLEPGSQSRNFSERILTACDRGKEIVAQILTFARDGVQQQRPVALCAFIRECEPLLSKAIVQGPVLTFSYAKNDVLVKGNSGQLLQLVSNLCVNASATCDQGRGSIHVNVDLPSSGEIAQIAKLPQDLGRHCIGIAYKSTSYVRVRVADDGAGIAPDVLPRIFDPFFTTKGRQHGSGLGLSVCHGIIESHEGFCLVETELGKGTCFSVFFPVIGEARRIMPEEPIVSSVDRGVERVMLVDDEQDVRDVMTVALQRLGYKVSAFDDPTDALVAFQKEPEAWDIVISDLIMPKMYGSELLERMKSINPDIPTILCSGYAEHSSAPISSSIGVHLSKPVSFPELNRCVRALLMNRSLQHSSL
jgi:signal transduction histidine kinase/CheY-like chemotaxis protein